MRRLIVCAVVLVALLLAATPAGAWVNPIQPANRAAPIPGAVNGELDPSLLVTVEGSCQLARQAAPSLVRLLADARAQGVALGTDSCYRPLSGQQSAHVNACSAGNCACAATPATSSNGTVVGTSAHGWGKAVDFTDGGAAMGFDSPGYGWLKANAARYGFSHPGWAEPGGSACPEAWHWEWVGDGGTIATPPRTVAMMASADGAGYWTVDGYGRVLAFGDAAYAGWADESRLVGPVVDAVAAPGGQGYLLATSDGGVLTFGSAHFAGSASVDHLAAPLVGLAASADGGGYWLVAADGGVFSFGDAAFQGSTGDRHLNAPIVAVARTPDGGGYWLIAADGGVFSFGDAIFHGSTGDRHLNAPIVAVARTPDGGGYWLVAADGGVFSFGDATFHGSTADVRLNAPITGMAASADGGGYWLVAADGGVFSFGDARFFGAGT